MATVLFLSLSSLLYFASAQVTPLKSSEQLTSSKQYLTQLMPYTIVGMTDVKIEDSTVNRQLRGYSDKATKLSTTTKSEYEDFYFIASAWLGTNCEGTLWYTYLEEKSVCRNGIILKSRMSDCDVMEFVYENADCTGSVIEVYEINNPFKGGVCTTGRSELGDPYNFKVECSPYPTLSPYAETTSFVKETRYNGATCSDFYSSIFYIQKDVCIAINPVVTEVSSILYKEESNENGESVIKAFEYSDSYCIQQVSESEEFDKVDAIPGQCFENTGCFDKTSSIFTLFNQKCLSLWDTNCASIDNKCAPGSQCVDYPYWSQCQEDTIESPASASDCFATNNGPNPGHRWGCIVDSDCCNPSAVCGSDKLCTLPTSCI